MAPLNGLLHAKFNNQDNVFLFITYDELIEQTQETIKKIYDFCGWEHFEHDLNNIVPKYKENDNEYKLYGLHDISRTITKPDSTIVLPQEIIDKCNYIDNNMKSLLKNKNETLNSP
jgi:hypothetical protein